MSRIYFENFILSIAYGLIDFIKGFRYLTEQDLGTTLQGIALRATPAIAVVYTAGTFAAEYTRKLQAVVEDALVYRPEQR